ncbi:alkaline phosphatase family protein [Planctomicrobium sp. SH664]|uniref:alkaline phosphatase family protein n=1 Tax=Planctomicrobium sp. SH664 TaxID=3448125 RepID=UPI003F5B9070
MPAVVLVSIPGLRPQDLERMPNLQSLAARGSVASLQPSFPALTCPVQANLTTGVGPEQHGIIANGFYYRDKGEVEMWTAWNSCFEAPQVWDLLHQHDSGITSAVWFPLHSKGAGADYICTPAPIHNPDGSESLWCYTKPTELYGEFRDTLGHFPLMHFWGPLANIKSSDWIIDSAVVAAKKFQPKFSYIYIPHLDYAAQKEGPDSPQALEAVDVLDRSLGRLIDGYAAAGLGEVEWLIASEYVITPVDAVTYPNRRLREGGFLTLQEENGREQLVVGESRAWGLVDHQIAHVFVRDAADVEAVAALFRADPLIEEVLVGEERSRYHLNHPRSGEIVLISRPNAWFAYYWWLDDAKAPEYAQTVDIHRKPGYDPVEMFIEMPSRKIPLDATRVKGSHGYPAKDASRWGVLVSSTPLDQTSVKDTDVTPLILKKFGAR